MFIVIMKGVYRHDIWGVRNTLEEAKELARKRLEAERDDWHSAEIVTMNGDDEVPIGEYSRKDNKTINHQTQVFEYGKREYTWKPSTG